MNKISSHIEWIFFLAALAALALMDPYSEGVSFCVFDQMGIPFCPGEGLGHSIAFVFRGEMGNAFNANLMGPAAVVVLGMRILSIWKDLWKQKSEAGENYE